MPFVCIDADAHLPVSDEVYGVVYTFGVGLSRCSF